MINQTALNKIPRSEENLTNANFSDTNKTSMPTCGSHSSHSTDKKHVNKIPKNSIIVYLLIYACD